MFYVYSKEANRSYAIYDDTDLSLEVCTVEEIRDFLSKGIKIKGVTLSGKSLKISVNKPSGLHITSGLADDVRDSYIREKFKLKDNTIVYGVYNDRCEFAIFIIGDKNCLLLLTTEERHEAYAVLGCMFRVLKADYFKGVALEKDMELLESIGVDFRRNINNKGFNDMVANNTGYQIIEKEPIGEPVYSFTIRQEQLRLSK